MNKEDFLVLRLLHLLKNDEVFLAQQDQIIELLRSPDEQTRVLGLGLLQLLSDNGETVTVTAHFEGSGDSGEIEDPLIGEDLNFGYFGSTDSYIDDLNSDLRNFIESKTDTYDWWNNDGGSGDITIEISPENINVEVRYHLNEVRTIEEIDTFQL